MGERRKWTREQGTKQLGLTIYRARKKVTDDGRASMAINGSNDVAADVGEGEERARECDAPPRGC
jgi:hypothetical protein